MRRLSGYAVVVSMLTMSGALTAILNGHNGDDWVSSGGNARRTAWIRTDTRESPSSISTSGVATLGLRLLWKRKLDVATNKPNTVGQPVLLQSLMTFKGLKSLSVSSVGSDVVYAIDYDLNRPFWEAHLDQNQKPDTSGCRGRPAALALPKHSNGAVSASHEVYAISGDGVIHVLNPQTGDEARTPIKVGLNVPVSSPVVMDGVLYALASDGCFGDPRAVLAVDLGSPTKTRATWELQGGTVTGYALGSDGTIYVATARGEPSESDYAGAIVALDKRSLKPKGWFKPGTSSFSGSPVVFQFKGKELVAAANRDGRLYVVDPQSLGRPDHHSSLAASSTPIRGVPSFTFESVASWESGDGTRWILTAVDGPIRLDQPFAASYGDVPNGAIAAFALIEEGAGFGLRPVWLSRDLIAPLTPMILNDVAFAVASGEYRSTGDRSQQQPVPRRSNALLCAFDGRTGRELWTSGDAISSWVHNVAPAGTGGQVHVVAQDGTLYAFGIPIPQ